jgi:2-polyprenyl-3-methyl-5-hydroxy-6-metoxy-1,4-benzoquinol methylase
MTSITERLFESSVATLEIFSVYLGGKLGLYQALRDRGSLTASELAEAAAIAPRYAREWLEQQAVAGLLEVDRTDGAADDRRYTLPADHIGPLCDPEHAEHLAPLAQILVGIGGALPRVVDAYRDGTGLSFGAYGHDLCCGQAAINRPAFTRDLPEQWLPSVPEVHDALVRGARVADVGCGQAWAAIAVARSYPASRVVGFDPDEASIEAAAENVRRAGVDVELVCRDARDLVADGPFDLVLILEALHDMARPDEVLTAIRQALAPGGSVIIGDEKVAEEFTAPGDPLERMMYGWSITHCLPAGLADEPARPTGTVIRPSTVRALADRAGFARCDILPIENDLFRFYRLAV